MIPRSVPTEPPEPQENQEVRPLTERLQEARAFIEKMKIDPDWFPKDEWGLRQRMFLVAREFARIGGDVEDYKLPAAILFQRIRAVRHVPDSTLWEYILSAYDSIRIDPRNNYVRWAYKMAMEEPIPLPTHVKARSEARKTIYSMAWHLSRNHWPAPFQLSRERIAEVMGMTKEAVSIAVNFLVKERLITALDEDGGLVSETGKKEHYIVNKRCKQYQLLYDPFSRTPVGEF